MDRHARERARTRASAREHADLFAAEDLVYEVGVALVLVLDDVVEHLEHEDKIAGVVLVAY